MQNENSKNQTDKSKELKAMIISFAGTVLVALATKVITMILATEQIDSIISYLAVNYSFWFQLLFGGGASALFVRHFVRKS